MKLDLAPAVAAVASHSHRLAELRIDAGSDGTVKGRYHLVIVNCHAPNAVDEEVKSDEYFAQLRKVTRAARRSQDALIVAGDFNARVGSEQDGHIGPFGPEEENGPGCAFHEYLQEFSMAAANTFFDGNPLTWTKDPRAEGRLDYCCVELTAMSSVKSCRARHDIDVRASVAEDHWPVELVMSIAIEPTITKTVDRVPWDATKFDEPEAMETFQEMCVGHVTPDGNSDVKLAALQATIKSGAAKAFPRSKGPPEKPSKDWIKAATWVLIQEGHHLKAEVRKCKEEWGKAGPVLPPPEWLCEARENLRLHQKSVKKAVRADRSAMWEAAADKVEIAAEAGDTKALHAAAKRLGGFTPVQLPAVKAKDGQLIFNQAEVEERWREHFAELLLATPAEEPAGCVEASQPVKGTLLHVDIDVVEKLIKKLKRGRAAGPDTIPAELIQAGGRPLALAVLQLLEHVIDTESIPSAWKGGKLCRLYKGKGDAATCGSYRGITVIDHLAKVLTTLLGPVVDGPLTTAMQNSQCGCSRGKGTARLSHFGRAFAEACAGKGRSAVMVFIDISKAFDQSIREFVLGIPRSVKDVKAHLGSLGLAEDGCERICKFLEDGDVLHRHGVDAKAARLLRDT